MFLLLSLHVELQHCSISRHINLNPRLFSASSKVPPHVWSSGFVFICPSRAPARAKGEYESSSWHRGDLVGITKKAIIHSHIHTQAHSGVLSSSIDCSNLLIAPRYSYGVDKKKCLLLHLRPPYYNTLYSSSHYGTRVSLSGDCHRGVVISFTTTDKGWNHLSM